MRGQKKSDIERYNSAFPTRLRAIMKEQKTTLKTVADFLKIRKQSVGCYTNGASSPDWETLVQLAQFFGVSVDWLLGVSDFRANETAEIPVKTIGFSEQAINVLVKLSQLEDPLSRHKIDVMNTMLEEEIEPDYVPGLLTAIANYVYPPKIQIQTILFSADGTKILNSDNAEEMKELGADPSNYAKTYETQKLLDEQLTGAVMNALNTMTRYQDWERMAEAYNDGKKPDDDGEYQDGD